MSSLLPTNIRLDKAQKEALSEKAKAHGTTLSVESRKAVDAYLADVPADELMLIDEASRKAAREVEEMNAVLDAGYVRSEAFFAAIRATKAVISPQSGGGHLKRKP
jgi:hypothetical protein